MSLVSLWEATQEIPRYVDSKFGRRTIRLRAYPYRIFTDLQDMVDF